MNQVSGQLSQIVKNIKVSCIKSVCYQHGIFYEQRVDMKSTQSYAHMNKNGSKEFPVIR